MSLFQVTSYVYIGENVVGVIPPSKLNIPIFNQYKQGCSGVRQDNSFFLQNVFTKAKRCRCILWLYFV
jgi:hypothetical protein